MATVKKLLALLLVAVMVLSLFVGCGSNIEETLPEAEDTQTTGTTEEVTGSNVESTGEPQYGGHLNVHVYNQPNGLDPLKQTGLWKYIWTTCVYENALTRDADNQIAPGVCNYEINGDMTELKLWVREGMTFHNGDTVEITDVEASINRALNQYNSIIKYVKPYVKSVTVDGDTLTVIFTEYNERCWYYFASWRTWMAIMPQEICEKYTGSFITDQIEDAIGTGPYKFSDFENNVQVSIEKHDGYVPCEAGHTGMASPKMGYLDSMTFHYNSDNSSATMALLSGDYDLTDVVDEEYQDIAAEQGIVKTVLPSNNGCMLMINTMGNDNICAKYPDLRKAIMAAIDYEEFLRVVSDNAAIVGGSMCVDEIYDTDAFENADYFGETDLDLAEQYLDAARAAGYADQPVQIVCDNTRDDIPTLLGDYLDNAGISYQLETMEVNTFNTFVGDPSNNWDIRFYWPTLAYTPTTQAIAVIETFYKSPAKDALLEEMVRMELDSEEYIAKWQELAQVIADDCAIVHMGTIDWFWYHPNTLHTNDEGMDHYLFNAYWDDPQNHSK